mmetsp:Transcript_6979/g.8043  ORF Transcript_6979/g.8043 Transcript_6979/m.8043 type:complete len:653 (-) Transcript_6979:877-2835(-)
MSSCFTLTVGPRLNRRHTSRPRIDRALAQIPESSLQAKLSSGLFVCDEEKREAASETKIRPKNDCRKTMQRILGTKSYGIKFNASSDLVSQSHAKKRTRERKRHLFSNKTHFVSEHGKTLSRGLHSSSESWTKKVPSLDSNESGARSGEIVFLNAHPGKKMGADFVDLQRNNLLNNLSNLKGEDPLRNCSTGAHIAAGRRLSSEDFFESKTEESLGRKIISHSDALKQHRQRMLNRSMSTSTPYQNLDYCSHESTLGCVNARPYDSNKLLRNEARTSSQTSRTFSRKPAKYNWFVAANCNGPSQVKIGDVGTYDWANNTFIVKVDSVLRNSGKTRESQHHDQLESLLASVSTAPDSSVEVGDGFTIAKFTSSANSDLSKCAKNVSDTDFSCRYVCRKTNNRGFGLIMRDVVKSQFKGGAKSLLAKIKAVSPDNYGTVKALLGSGIKSTEATGDIHWIVTGIKQGKGIFWKTTGRKCTKEQKRTRKASYKFGRSKSNSCSSNHFVNVSYEQRKGYQVEENEGRPEQYVESVSSEQGSFTPMIQLEPVYLDEEGNMVSLYDNEILGISGDLSKIYKKHREDALVSWAASWLHLVKSYDTLNIRERCASFEECFSSDVETMKFSNNSNSYNYEHVLISKSIRLVSDTSLASTETS